jgi:uncharacterized protein
MSSNKLNLTEDEIEDLLYLVRTNDLPDLQQLLKELSAKYTASKAQILTHSADPETGNSPLHYACANGHIGECRSL